MIIFSFDINTYFTSLSFSVYDNANQNDYAPSFEQFGISQSEQAEYVEFGTVLADGGDRFGVSAVTFDTQEELLWMGNEGVNIFEIIYIYFSF